MWSLWESSLTLSDGPKALFLFDIDGTLISPGKTARNIFIEIVRELTSREVTLEVHQVAGFTDPNILENMLQRAGLNDSEIYPVMKKFFPMIFTLVCAGRLNVGSLAISAPSHTHLYVIGPILPIVKNFGNLK